MLINSMIATHMRCYLILFTLLGAVSSVAKDFADEASVRGIRKEFGVILTREQAPEVYDILEKPLPGQKQSIIDLLGQGQLSIIESNALAVNKLYIVDSARPFFQVERKQEEGSRLALNSVFITTGFLAEVLGVSNVVSVESFQASFEKNMPRLVGALAYAFADPVDKLSADSIEDNMGARKSQAQNLLTDTNAMRLLEAADLSIDFFYEYILFAREYLFSESKWKVAVAASVEADMDLRMATAEAYYTARRFERGATVVDNSYTIDQPRAERMFEVIQDKSRRVEMLTVKSLASFQAEIDRLGELPGDQHDRSQAEFLMEVNSRFTFALMAIEGELDDGRRVEKIALLMKILKNHYSSSGSSEAVGTNIRHEMELASLLKPYEIEGMVEIRSPVSYVRDSEYFRSPQAIQDFAPYWEDFERISKAQYGLPEKFAGVWGAIIAFLPPEVVASKYASEIKEGLGLHFLQSGDEINLSNPTDQRFSLDPRKGRFGVSVPIDIHWPISDGFSFLELRPYFYDTWIREVWPKLSASEKEIFMAREMYNMFGGGDSWNRLVPMRQAGKRSDYYPLELPLEMAEEVLTRFRQKAESGDKMAAQLLDSYKHAMAILWEYRGFIGAVEIGAYRSDFSAKIIDWLHILKVLEIGEQEGLAEIKKETLRILRDESHPHRALLLETLLIGSNEARPETEFVRERKQIIDEVESKWTRDNKDTAKPLWLEVGETLAEEVTELLRYARDSKASHKMLARSIEFNADDFQKIYEDRLRQRVAELPINFDASWGAIRELHEVIDKEIFGLNRNVKDLNPQESYLAARLPVDMIHALVIYDSDLPIDTKRKWIQSLFLVNSPFRGEMQDGSAAPKNVELRSPVNGSLFQRYWLNSMEGWRRKKAETLFPILFELGLIESAIEFLLEIRPFYRVYSPSETYPETAPRPQKESHDNYFRLLGHLTPFIEGEIRQMSVADKKKALPNVLKILTLPSGEPFRKFNSGIMDIKKSLITDYDSVYKDVLPAKDFFKALVESNPTVDTDQFLRDYVEKGLSGQELREYLIADAIYDKSEKIRLTEIYLADEVSLMVELVNSGRRPGSIDLYNLFDFIEVINPESSQAKDKYLEDLAWKLDLRGRELHVYVVEKKSSHITRPNKLSLPDWGSAIMSVARDLPEETRIGFMSYFKNPRSQESAQFLTTLSEDLTVLPLEEAEIMRKYLGYGLTEGFRQDAILLVMAELEHFAFSGHEFEKTFVINGILRAGGLNAVIDRPDFLDRAINETLGYKKDSQEDRLIRVFLTKTLPNKSMGPAIGYMIAMSKGGQLNSAELFKVFHTIGIKFGQQAGNIWQIFGERIARETRDLKDKADGLAKDVIEARLKERYPNDYANIALKTRKGAASIKTVVEVVFLDQPDRKQILYVRDMYIIGQIATNIRMAKSFIAELEASRDFESSEFFRLLVDAMEAQIYREINFMHELEMLRKLRPMTDKLNRELGLNWQMEVVRPVDRYKSYEDLAWVSSAEGIPFDEVLKKQNELGLSDKDVLDIGKAIVRYNLALFFRLGWFEPDRHHGNQLIDLHPDLERFKLMPGMKGLIHVFDVGQLEEFSTKHTFSEWDQRLIVARYLEAVQGGDAELLYRMALKMSESKALSRSQAVLVVKEVSAIMKKHDDLQVRFRESTKVLVSHGIELEHKFTFTIVKGFMTLYKENYVPLEEFTKILKDEVGRLYIRRAFVPEIFPRVLKEVKERLFGNGGKARGAEAPTTKSNVIGGRCMQLFAR